MPLVFYTGEYGEQPPIHQILEIAFPPEEVAKAGYALQLAMAKTPYTRVGSPAYLLNRTLGGILADHARIQKGMGVITRGLNLNVVEAGLLAGPGPESTQPILANTLHYIAISRIAFGQRAAKILPDLVIEERKIRYRTLNRSFLY